jgi:hypothetical protein
MGEIGVVLELFAEFKVTRTLHENHTEFFQLYKHSKGCFSLQYFQAQDGTRLTN